MSDDTAPVELGWIKVTKVLDPDAPAGVDVRYSSSAHLPLVDALGMLAAAQHSIWDGAGEGRG